MLGVALVGVGWLVGKVYGPRAERRYNRILWTGLLGSAALALVIVLIWFITHSGGGSQPATTTAAAETEAVETTDLSDDTKQSCKRLAETAQKFSAVLKEGNFDQFGEEFYDFAIFSFLAIVPEAPDEIRDDLRVLDDALTKYVDAIIGADFTKLDQETLDQQLQTKLSTEIDLQRVTQASQNISAWVRESCS